VALGDGGISAVGATRDAADDEAEARRDERDQWQTATHKAERVAEQVEQVQQLIATAEQEAARRFKIAAGLTRARQAQETAEKAAREALETSKIEAGRASRHRSTVEPLHKELSGLGVDRPVPDPGGSVDVLRAAWKGLNRELAESESRLPEAGRLSTARARVGDAAERLRPFSEEAAATAVELASTVEASTQTGRTDTVQRAMNGHEAARRIALTAANAVEEAERKLRAAEPASDHQNHFDLVGTEWAWSTVEEIADSLDRLEIRNTELLQARSDAETAFKHAEQLRDEVDAWEVLARMGTSAGHSGHTGRRPPRHHPGDRRPRWAGSGVECAVGGHGDEHQSRGHLVTDGGADRARPVPRLSELVERRAEHGEPRPAEHVGDRVLAPTEALLIAQMTVASQHLDHCGR
jgi:hypothetical protein